MKNITTNEKTHPAATECGRKSLYEELEKTAHMINEELCDRSPSRKNWNIRKSTERRN